MAIDLSQSFVLDKGATFNLTKTIPGLSKVLIGAGWEANELVNGADYDIDLSLFLTDNNNQMVTTPRQTSGFVGFIFPNAINHSFKYGGDNKRGASFGDAEFIEGDFSQVGPEVSRIHVTASIHGWRYRKQTFDQMRNAYLRIVDQTKDKEICRVNLTNEARGQVAIILGCFYRDGTDWHFRSDLTPIQDGMRGLFAYAGVTVQEEDDPDL